MMDYDVPYAIVNKEGVLAAIVPERTVGEIMTSALIPNMGYRMECRPATQGEILQVASQLRQALPPEPPKEEVRYELVDTQLGKIKVEIQRPDVRHQAVEGVGQRMVVIPTFRDPNRYEPKVPTL